jgi:putative PLP-dependent aminotransferase (TIGR04422 family)
MKKNSFFLWPDTSFSFGSFFSSVSVTDLESEFHEMFTEATPVIFSSARASLSAILLLQQMGRADKIWCPPFSSHCVLEAVARVATPSISLDESRSVLIYHQWGFVHNTNGKEVCIEDSADSFLIPGEIQFPNNGKFQVVSLPKIYGCAGGGIVFCKEADDAEKLRSIRDERKSHAVLQLLLKLSGNAAALQYWGGVEAGEGKPTAAVCKEISNKIKHTDRLLADRKEKIELVRNISPGWLQFSTDRMPCAIPVELERVKTASLEIGGYTITPRHFNPLQDISVEKLIKVFPVPVHQDIDLNALKSFVKNTR